MISQKEQASFMRVHLSADEPFELRALGERTRRLVIQEPADFGEGMNEKVLGLVREVMMAHVVGRHLPRTIETNWDTGSAPFMAALYQHYGFKPPEIKRADEQVNLTLHVSERQKSSGGYEWANAHSGGLDSVYRLLELMSEGEEVVPVHLRNLNPKGNADEAEASRAQAELLGLPYAEIRLINSTDNTGYQTMRTRDMLLALLVGVYGSQVYGVRRVMIEGDMKTEEEAEFTEFAPAWIFFNDLLAQMNLDVVVKWMDAGDMGTVGEILRLGRELQVDALSLVHNCFSAPFQRNGIRKKWARETPVLYEASPAQWCGSCYKCRRMTLGRIWFSDPALDLLPMEEVHYFVQDTDKWMKDYPHHRSLISDEFIKCLDGLRD